MFLRAHNNLNNKALPDSLAWYIENQIAIIYTERDEFEKASYFSGLVERSLKHYQIHDKLSRWYTNQGRRLKSERKIESARQAFIRGYELADSISYVKGMFANALNLAELYNEYTELGNSALYLQVSDSLLVLLANEENYNESESRVFFEKANDKFNQGLIEESIELYKKSIESLT